MRTICVRCSQPTEGVLCETCRARLRILLTARAGVRRAAEGSMHWPAVGIAVLVLILVMGGLLRQVGGVAEPPRAAPGVWRILGGAEFLRPVGLALDRLGNLYVVDAASYHIYKLAPDGTLLATFGSRGSAPGQFDRPTAIALDPIGNLYVADTANSRIEKLSATGVALATWGTRGNGGARWRHKEWQRGTGTGLVCKPPRISRYGIMDAGPWARGCEEKFPVGSGANGKLSTRFRCQDYYYPGSSIRQDRGCVGAMRGRARHRRLRNRLHAVVEKTGGPGNQKSTHTEEARALRAQSPSHARFSAERTARAGSSRG